MVSNNSAVKSTNRFQSKWDTKTEDTITNTISRTSRSTLNNTRINCDFETQPFGLGGAQIIQHCQRPCLLCCLMTCNLASTHALYMDRPSLVPQGPCRFCCLIAGSLASKYALYMGSPSLVSSPHPE